MKRAAAFAYCLLLSSLPVSAADPGPGRGFRGFTFGDSPKGMVAVPFKCSAAGAIRMDMYWSPEDLGTAAKRSVAGHDTSGISYCFYKERLCRIEIEWERVSRPVFNQMANALSMGWGKPDATTSEGRRLWNSQDGRTSAFLLPAPEDGVLLAIADKRCAQQIARDEAGL
jgi:hypothetical protein